MIKVNAKIIITSIICILTVSALYYSYVCTRKIATNELSLLSATVKKTPYYVKHKSKQYFVIETNEFKVPFRIDGLQYKAMDHLLAEYLKKNQKIWIMTMKNEGSDLRKGDRVDLYAFGFERVIVLDLDNLNYSRREHRKIAYPLSFSLIIIIPFVFLKRLPKHLDIILRLTIILWPALLIYISSLF